MKRIFLVGYMGSGKTTIGKRLAEKLGLQFVDLDLFIENRYRKTVGQIFAEKGESAFREIESRALQEIVGFEDVIVSTGGGVPCFFDNMALMNEWGVTIYLKVSVEELAGRLNSCKQNRPLIKDKNKEELQTFIAESLERREGYYKQSALVFDAEKLLTQTDVDTIVSHLIQFLERNEKIKETTFGHD